MAADDDEVIDRIWLAALKGPQTGVHALTYAPSGLDEFAACPACGTAWDDCDASQQYAVEEDEACCGDCEHKWIEPPAPYVITEIGG